MDNIDNLKELKKYVDFMTEHDLQQLEIEKDGKRVNLKKHCKGGIVNAVPNYTMSASKGRMEEESGSKGAAAGKDSKYQEIKSPMVGTFYRAPAPDAPPYVDKGQAVKKGDVVCIIEAMKLMNEIKAEFAGVVKDVLVENGEPVEFGQSLFLIEPV